MRNAARSLVAVVIGLGACVTICNCTKKSAEEPPRAGDGTAAPADEGGASGLCAGEHVKGPLGWFHDDWAAAEACARETGRPIVIDEWAPWCHTCLAMQHGVLVDRALAPLADRFVWLAVDTDKPENAAVVERFPPKAWPTFYVVSPGNPAGAGALGEPAIQARFVGAGSLDQIREFLRQGEQGHLDARAAAGGLPVGSPLRDVREGDRAAAARQYADADRAYARALAKTPADWPRRPDVLVSLIGVRVAAGDTAGCAALARDEAANTGNSASAADFSYYVTRCAERPDQAGKRALLELARDRLAALLADASAPLSVDDRSDATRIAREVAIALGDEASARELATAQRALLDTAARAANTPLEAMTYNWPRAEVYAYLGVPAELVPDLERSARDLPRQYDPPYRLAWVLLQAGKPDDALPHAERALGLVYGPRKANVQRLIANIHAARGDAAGERAALAAVIAIYEALPPGQRRQDWIDRATEALAAFDARTSGSRGAPGAQR